MKQESIRHCLEIIEPSADYEQILSYRTSNLQHFPVLGAPDMVYLTKSLQQKNILKRQQEGAKVGYYHYVFGLFLESPGMTSVYLNALINEQERNQKWFSNGEWQITKGVFCVYDAFCQQDVRVEINLPGQMKIY